MGITIEGENIGTNSALKMEPQEPVGLAQKAVRITRQESITTVIRKTPQIKSHRIIRPGA